MERISSGDDSLPLKIILVLLVYGKADFAAWMFDRTRERIDGSLRKPLEETFKSLRGRRLGASGLHTALDYFARKV
jgi:hypothetical protein